MEAREEDGRGGKTGWWKGGGTPNSLPLREELYGVTEYGGGGGHQGIGRRSC